MISPAPTSVREQPTIAAPPRVRRRVCFVTGTRAEYGLMRTTLDALDQHAGIEPQLIATGTHLDPSHGRTVADIRGEGRRVHAEVSWPATSDRFAYAAAVGRATADLAAAYAKVRPDVVLVVGDRVEAFAAAQAAHLAGVAVAHVHGGDRATGQADDALRHATTKLAHLHLAATPTSAERILKLGEDPWRVHAVGAPGIDGITEHAAARSEVAVAVGDGPFALLIYHPTRDDDAGEWAGTRRLLDALLRAGVPKVVAIGPNNDPGHRGIAGCLSRAAATDRRVRLFANLPRPLLLGLMRDAALMIGNSSSGIIEAASFGLPVIDVGPRQHGRERGGNVCHVDDRPADLSSAVQAIWNDGRPQRWAGTNVYGGTGAGERIAQLLATTPITPAFLRKTIAY